MTALLVACGAKDARGARDGPSRGRRSAGQQPLQVLSNDVVTYGVRASDVAAPGAGLVGVGRARSSTAGGRSGRLQGYVVATTTPIARRVSGAAHVRHLAPAGVDVMACVHWQRVNNHGQKNLNGVVGKECAVAEVHSAVFSVQTIADVVSDAAVVGLQSPRIQVDSASLKASEQARYGGLNQFSGAMDCYVTIQESGKRLTEPASLPLIVQVMKWTVGLLLSAWIPPPCERKTISAVSQSSNGAMDCYVTV